MKKIFFVIPFLLFTAANNWLTGTSAPAPAGAVVVIHGDFDATEIPLGEGEEQSGEEDKDFSEDDDQVGFHDHWMSRDKSSNANLHFLYQEIVFHDLELTVIIPPPKA